MTIQSEDIIRSAPTISLPARLLRHTTFIISNHHQHCHCYHTLTQRVDGTFQTLWFICPSPLLVTRTLLKKLRAILWFPTRITLFHAVLFILCWTCTWERVNVSFFFLGSIVELYIVIVLVCVLVRILVQVVCTNSYCAVEPISPAAPISHLNRRQMSARLSKKTLFVPCTVCPQCAHTVCIILPQCVHICT